MRDTSFSLNEYRLLLDSLGFEIRFAAGAVRLVAESIRLFPFLVIDRIELELIDVELPIDMSQGAEAFHLHPARLVSLQFSVGEEGLAEFVSSLSGGQISDVQLHGTSCTVLVALDDGKAPRLFTCTAELRCNGTASLFAELTSAPPLSWHDEPVLLCLRKVLESLPVTLPPRFDRWNRIQLRLLSTLLGSLFFPENWFVPSFDRVGLVGLTAVDGGIQFSCSSDPETQEWAPATALDAALLAGQYSAALREVSRLDGSGLAEQLATQLLLSNPASRAEGFEQAHHQFSANPLDTHALAQLVAIERYRHHNEMAVSYLMRLAELADQRADRVNGLAARLALADIHSKINTAAAIDTLTQVLRLKPLFVPALQRLAPLYFRHGRQQDLEDLEQTISSGLKSTSTLAYHLDALQAVISPQNRLHGLVTVISELAGQMAATPRRSGVLTRLARIEQSINRSDEALAHAEEALTLDPKSPSAFLLLRDILRQRGQFQRYLELVQQWTARYPGQQTVEVTLEAADVLLDLGDSQRAEAAYCEVLNLDASNRAALWGLRRIYRAQRQQAPLLRVLSALVDLPQADPERQDVARELIENLFAINAHDEIAPLLNRWQRDFGETPEWIGWTSRLNAAAYMMPRKSR